MLEWWEGQSGAGTFSKQLTLALVSLTYILQRVHTRGEKSKLLKIRPLVERWKIVVSGKLNLGFGFLNRDMLSLRRKHVEIAIN